jgi:hypothetical protein
VSVFLWMLVCGFFRRVGLRIAEAAGTVCGFLYVVWLIVTRRAGRFMFAPLLAAVVAAATACAPAPEGYESAQSIPHDTFVAALTRVGVAQKLDEDCIDVDVRYRVIDGDSWQHGRTQGLSDGDGMGPWLITLRAKRADWTLEHEVVHVLLGCSGAGLYDNLHHIGEEWTGFAH